MPVTALLLVLGSAVIHAGWNTLLAGARDSRAATNLALAVGTLVLAPVALTTWELHREATPFVIASAALELVYVMLLGTAYDHTELSLVYPIARGLSPVGVLLITLAVGGGPGLTGAVGALLVGAGILGLGGIDRRGVGLGVAIGCVLATITTVDKFGIEHASTFTYLFIVIAPAALVSLVTEAARGRGPALRREMSGRTLLAGVGFVGTYSLILSALQLASAASVASVRETSIVVAVALGALALREPVTWRRAVAACVVSAGAALAALGA